MAVELVGNLFRHMDEYNTIVIPCNGVLRSNLSLVMGAGVARTCTRLDLPPLGEHLPDHLGTCIIRLPHVPMYRDQEYYQYGFCLSEYDDRVGAFQSKLKPEDKSTIDLLWYSMLMMLDKLGYDRKVAMFYPGIGLGGLTLEQARSVLLYLPNNYHLWRREQ